MQCPILHQWEQDYLLLYPRTFFIQYQNVSICCLDLKLLGYEKAMFAHINVNSVKNTINFYSYGLCYKNLQGSLLCCLSIFSFCVIMKEKGKAFSFGEVYSEFCRVDFCRVATFSLLKEIYLEATIKKLFSEFPKHKAYLLSIQRLDKMCLIII